MECVKCKSGKTIEGRVFNQTDYVSSSAFFRPRELKPFELFGIHTRIKKNHFFACLDCGVVWAAIDTKNLEEIILEHGNKTVRERLGLDQAS